jgi:protein TonB
MSPATPNAAPSFSTLDRAAGRRMSPQSVGIAVVVNLALLLVLLFQKVNPTHISIPPIKSIYFESTPPPPPVAPSTSSNAIHGGGGNVGLTPPSAGNPPMPSPEQLNPPKVPPITDPPIKIATTIDMQTTLRPKLDLSKIGTINSPLAGNSLGNARGKGDGPGDGDGYGPGHNRDTGGGFPTIGVGGVSAPVVLFAPEPQFSEEARRKKVSGNVLVYLQVDVNGRPTHVRVVRGIGLGLDEQAIDAVSHYKFKPAMENGHPVAVEMNVNVDFNIY